jgi:hypothetical protein
MKDLNVMPLFHRDGPIHTQQLRKILFINIHTPQPGTTRLAHREDCRLLSIITPNPIECTHSEGLYIEKTSIKRKKENRGKTT